MNSEYQLRAFLTQQPTHYSMSPKSNDNEASMQYSKDEQLLASLGYKQELKRDFHWVELLCFSFSVISVASAIT